MKIKKEKKLSTFSTFFIITFTYMNFLRYMQGILALAVHVIACRGQHYAFQHTPCEEEEEEATLTLDSFFFFFFFYH